LENAEVQVLEEKRRVGGEVKKKEEENFGRNFNILSTTVLP